MSSTTDEQDEQNVLASLHASIQEQDTYEDNVIREATHQLAPEINGIGFPSLHALAPSFNKNRHDEDYYNPADLPAVHKVLGKVRKEIAAAAAVQQQQPSNNNNDHNNNDVLYLKEQMLISFLHSVAGFATNDLPVREQDERAAEQTRAVQCQKRRRRQQQSSASSENTTTRKRDTAMVMGMGFDSSSNKRLKPHQRVPMMQRKQIEAPRRNKKHNHDEDDDGLEQETPEFREKLRQIRKEREQRKQERRQQLLLFSSSDDDDDSTEDEEEEAQADRDVESPNPNENSNPVQPNDNEIIDKAKKSEISESPTIKIDPQKFKEENNKNVLQPNESKNVKNNETKATVTIPKTENTQAKAKEELNIDLKTNNQSVKQEENNRDDNLQKPEIDDTEPSQETTISCPLCLESMSVADPSNVDAELSKHMNDCQHRSGSSSRRPTRRSAARAAQSIYNATREEQEMDDEEFAFKQTKRNTDDDAYINSNTVMEEEEEEEEENDNVQLNLKDQSRLKKETESLLVSDNTNTKKQKKKKKSDKKSKKSKLAASKKTALDDYDEWAYEDRVDDWIANGLGRMKQMTERDQTEDLPGEEIYPGGLVIPAWINDSVFGYQREGLKWLWELHHEQQAGGIIGDEMGLGKTVQTSAYLGAAAASRKLKSVLIVSPATMLQHWLNELAKWAPGLRRILIHPSGEVDGVSRSVSNKLLRACAKWLKESRKNRVNEPIDEQDMESTSTHAFCGTGYVIITTYENLRRNADIYTAHEWSYIVLDEAQKIRNPDADITLACKRIRTPHRIAISGTPIQNDLKELWSLFDFVFPGRLGTLPAFEQEFAIPIRRGGYSNASPMQVQLAYRCALTLRDLIEPFLLRRLKKDVKEVSRMPGKTEHVLFCRLSGRQREMYEAFLKSDEVARVIRGTNQMFAAVTMLRKISNHPDLVCDPDQASLDSFLNVSNDNPNPLVDDDDDDEENNEDIPGADGDDDLMEEQSLIERSGKLEVLSKILPLWKKQGHRVLIFCQWKKMLNIIQRFMMLKQWKFSRLDGNTNVANRQRLVDEYNNDESCFAMLCTTRTGGVGLNLTGANRIILYDPDWNPSTDQQARERVWRFGQKRDVTIYRLITAGTIEEKIYHRQIFKTALSNKVLQDPRQRRLFSQRDLKDLFTLNADTGSVRSGGDGITETSKVTKGVGVIDRNEDFGDDETNKDNEDTLKNVMRSKGLAGIFDHHSVEQDPSRKTTTVREMEEQAKRVAREALNALEQSVASQNRFAPTWTGSEETKPSRFGGSSKFGPGKMGGMNSASSGVDTSSSSLLASLRQRNSAAESGGATGAVSDETQKYAGLAVRLKNFIRQQSPSTEEILDEFSSSVPDSDVAIFRRLLKSVAFIEDGKWYLN